MAEVQQNSGKVTKNKKCRATSFKIFFFRPSLLTDNTHENIAMSFLFCFVCFFCWFLMPSQHSKQLKLKKSKQFHMLDLCRMQTSFCSDSEQLQIELTILTTNHETDAASRAWTNQIRQEDYSQLTPTKTTITAAVTHPRTVSWFTSAKRWTRAERKSLHSTDVCIWL